MTNAVEKGQSPFSTGGRLVRRRARRVCVSYEVWRKRPHMRPEALHSSASLKRIHWILFNCAGYNMNHLNRPETEALL